MFQLDVLESKRRRRRREKKKKNLSSAPSVYLSVSLFLSPPPPAFPLIFNKQQLRLSATGRQFVPTNKKPWQQPLEEPVRFQKGPPSLPVIFMLMAIFFQWSSTAGSQNSNYQTPLIRSYETFCFYSILLLKCFQKLLVYGLAAK